MNFGGRRLRPEPASTPSHSHAEKMSIGSRKAPAQLSTQQKMFRAFAGRMAWRQLLLFAVARC
jgi:hypothetical protein